MILLTVNGERWFWGGVAMAGVAMATAGRYPVCPLTLLRIGSPEGDAAAPARLVFFDVSLMPYLQV